MTEKAKGYKHVSVRMKREMYDELRRACEQSPEETMSAVIRRLVYNFLAQERKAEETPS